MKNNVWMWIGGIIVALIVVYAVYQNWMSGKAMKFYQAKLAWALSKKSDRWTKMIQEKADEAGISFEEQAKIEAAYLTKQEYNIDPLA